MEKTIKHPVAVPLDSPQRSGLAARVAVASRLILYLDFDGTLAPIVAHPEMAQLPPETRSVLEHLSSQEGVKVCVISGRALADVKARVALPSLVYCGDHGLEIQGEALRFEHPEAALRRPALQVLNQRLAGLPILFPGVQVEPKPLTTSIHYRRADESARDQLAATLRSLVPPDDPALLVTEGKKIFEIRPRVDWNKGMAVRWLQDRFDARNAVTIILGDDRTDEDAFRALEDAITIHVGLGASTCARYCLSDSGAVGELLGWLLRVWQDRRGRSGSGG